MSKDSSSSRSRSGNGKPSTLVFDDASGDVHVAVDYDGDVPPHYSDVILKPDDIIDGPAKEKHREAEVARVAVDNDADSADPQDKCSRVVQKIQTCVHGFLQKNSHLFQSCCYCLLLLGYVAYFCYAIWYSPTGALVLIFLTSIVAFFVCYNLIKKKFGKKIQTAVYDPVATLCLRPWWKYIRW